MNYIENRIVTGQPEYGRDFWSFMRGSEAIMNKLDKGRTIDTGTYAMPVSTDSKYEKAIAKEGAFRNIASVFTSYDAPSNIWATDCDDLAEFVDEFGSISITDVADDFTRILVSSNKLAALVRLSTEFIRDAAFDLEGYLIKRLAKNFGRAEDKAFITGTGVKEPVGILNTTGGADVSISTNSITYDDVISLYFSVAPEYRSNGVWLMNDVTAMALRKLKNGEGNYLWNNADSTILGKLVIVSEYMPNASSGTKPIAFGDFSYYWVVKRSPVTVKMLKELFALRDQTGYLAYEFLDGKLIRPDAIKVLQMA